MLTRPIRLLLLAAPIFAQQYPFVPVPNSPDNITRLMQDSRGRLWVGTSNDLLCFDGSRFYSLRSAGFTQAQVKDMAEDSDGGIWAASTSALYRFE